MRLVSLKIPNKADSNIFDLFSVYLKTIDHLSLKIVDICRHTASFKSSGFLNFEVSPMMKAT